MGKISDFIGDYRASGAIPLLILLSFCLYFLIVTHFEVLPGFGKYNEKRLLGMVLILFVVSMSMIDSRSRKDFLAILSLLSPAAKIMLLFVASMGVFSSAQAEFPGFALLEASLFTLLFAGCICIACCYVKLGDLFSRFMAATLFVLGWFYLATFLGYYLNVLVNDIPLTRYSIMSSNFANVRFFNQFQSWSLPLMVTPLLVFDRRSFFIKCLFVLVAMGWWLLLFASACRGTMLGCMVAFPVTLLIFGKRAKEWAKWQVLAIIGGLAGYLLFYTLIPRLMGMEVEGILDRDLVSSSMRVELWDAAWEMTRARPWLGGGPMQYAAGTTQIAAHPHNSLLQVAAEWGIPVALTAMALFLGGLWRWLKKIKSLPSDCRERKVHAALFASLLTASVHSLFSGIIVMPLSQLMMVLVIGWMLGVSVRGSQLQQNHSLWTHLVLSLAILAAVFGLIRPLFPEILHLEELQTEFLDSHPEEKILKPRFWLQGRLAGYKVMSKSGIDG